MRRRTAWFAGALVCAAAGGCATVSPPDVRAAPDGGLTELTLVRSPTANEAVALELRVGILPSGARVRILSEAGDVLGVVAPFGRLQAGGVSAHVIPLPAGAIREGRLRVSITLHVPGAPARAPRQGEVEKVSLIFVPVGLG